MATRNDQQEAPKGKFKNKADTKPDVNTKLSPQETPPKIETDMEPDEFLAPNADTDLPIDHQVLNDAVLRGEGHANENVNIPSRDKKNKDSEEKI
jgi:hypothetical protein